MKFTAIFAGLMAGITMAPPTPAINEIDVAKRETVTDARLLNKFDFYFTR
jgi:hypothetical protein